MTTRKSTETAEKNTKIEILAPAGGFDSVIAAVRSGADAVYLGEKSFSARASAHNFDDDELKKAVAYCHVHGVKLYVTLNTLVRDNELEAMKNAVRAAAEADADALIIQSPGIARLAMQVAPGLALHASTQMSVHTASGVRALYEQGFKRVVLAREMSRKEIIKAAQAPVELEVFVHGALCMSVSGQCYFSATLGSRSGNRGACAQTCRLPFYIRQKGNHALSLKDNSLIPYLQDMQEIGVCSAKIEGRMKRPEYVAAAVAACREQRDLDFVTEKTQRMLRGVFSRTGFTDGYYTGKRGTSMFGTRTKDDVLSAGDKLLSEVRRSYKDEIRNVEINGAFTAKTGERAVLKLSDGAHTVEVKSDAVCEPAEKTPLDAEKCSNQLCKTGGSAYYISSLRIDIEGEPGLPLSALNRMRREAVEQLDKERAVVHGYEIFDPPLDVLKTPYRSTGFGTRAVVPGTKLSPAFKECELVYVPLFSDVREISRLLGEGFRAGVEIPRAMFDREEQIEKQLERVKELGVEHALCHNIGAAWLAKRQGFKLHGGFGLNLFNTLDLLWAEEYGFEDVELSLELSFPQIKSLGGSIPRGFVSYGYLPMMLCRSCPAKSEGIDCKSCKSRSVMTDRMGKRFMLKCDGTATEVLNCVPLYVDKKEFPTFSTSFHTLRFTVENYVENVESIIDFTPNPMLKDKTTRGLTKRGVE